MNMTLIHRAVQICGSQSELARRMARRPQLVSAILAGKRRVTGDTALLIENATGGQITARALRPDLFPVGAGPAEESEAA
jgi:DNA-binding transcriptional regulator YdaS (Cro superfamily)